MPDFFVSFGSNAGKWAAGLKEELDPAHLAIADLTARLKTLQETATAVAQGTEGKLSGVRLPGAGGQPEVQAGSARIGMPDLERFVLHLGTLHDELDGVITKIKVAADATAQTAQSMRGAGESMSRSASQIRRHLETPQPYAPAGSRDVKPGTFLRTRGQDALPGLETYGGRAPAAPPATIPATPQAVVDEAGLGRVVAAIEQNVTATRAVESAIARLGGVQQGADPEYEQALAEYQRAAAEHARATQVAQQAARGREEQAARPAEAEQLTTLQLAGSEDVLRRQSKDELRRIQDAYQEAGYQQARTRSDANMDERQAAVRAAHQAYTEAAGVTKQGTVGGGQEVRGETAREVRAAVEEVVTTVRRVLGGAAEEILKTGKRATHEELEDLAKTARAQGGLPGTTVESERGVTHRYGDIQAELAKRGQQVPAAAVQQAMRLSQLPGFQPYDPHFQSQIRERAAEQQDPELRMEFGRAYASLTRAVDALDLIAGEVVGQYRKVAAAEQRLAEATTEAARKQAQQSLGREQQRLQSIPNWSQFLTPEFQRGMELRAPARAAQQEYYKTAAEAADLRKQTTVAPALFSALFNPAEVAGQTHQTLPGVRYTQYGSNARLGYASDYERTYSETGDEYEERDPKKLDQLRSRVSKLAKALEAKFQATQSEAAAAADEVEAAWERVLRAYANVFPEIGYLTGLKTRLDDVAAQVQATRTQPSQPSPTREGEAEVQAANVRLVQGAEPPQPPRPPVPPLPPGAVPFRGGDGSDRIVAAINSLHNTVRAGLRGQPAGRATIRETPPEVTVTARGPREPVTQLAPRSAASPEARQQYLGTLPDDLQQLVRTAAETKDAEAGVAAAVELVRRGFLTQRNALSLLRAEMNQSVATAKVFQAAVRTALEGASLLDPARLQRAQARQQRQLGQQLAGVPESADPYKKIRESMTAFYSQQGQESRRQARADLEQLRQLRAQMANIGQSAKTPEASLTPNIDPGFIAKVRAQIIPFQEGVNQTVRSQQQLDIVLGKVSQSLQEEILDYRKAVVAGLEFNEVMERQTRIYQRLQTELAGRGVKVPEINQTAKTALDTPQSPVGQDEVKQIRSAATLRNLPNLIPASEMQRQGTEAGGLLRRFMAAAVGDGQFWNRILHSTGTFIVRNFSAGLVFGVANQLQEALRQAIETEATFVKVSGALEATGRATVGLRTDLQQISTDYGAKLNDVYETTANLVGLFDTPKDLAGAARIVEQLELITRGALNAQEATGALASITASFGDLRSVEGMQHIADVLTVIQQRVGVNAEVTAEGIGRLSGLAQQVGLTFEQTAVFVAEVAKKTNQTGAAAGEQLSRILATMETGRGRAALLQVLPAGSGAEQALATRNYGKVLEILLGNYQNLTKAQQDNIAVTLGGARQMAAFQALLKDGASALATVAAAEHANGEAADYAQKIQKNLVVQLQKVQQNIVNLAQNLLRSGLADFFGVLLQLTNGLLGNLNQLLSKLNDLADQNGVVRFLTHMATGLVGVALAVVAVRKAIAGLRSVLGRGAGAEKVEATEQTLFASGGIAPAGISATGDRAEQAEEKRLRAEERAERRKQLQEERGRYRGGLASLFEGGGQRAQATSGALAASAERQAEEAALRAAGLSQAAIPLRERPASDAGKVLVAGLKEIPGGAKAIESTTKLASHGMKGVSTALGAMANASGLVGGAIGAAATLVIAWLVELDKQRAEAKQTQDLWKQSIFGKAETAGQSNGSDGKTDLGPFAKAAADRIDKAQSKMGGLEILARTTMDAAAESIGEFFKHPVTGMFNDKGQAFYRQIFSDLFDGGGKRVDQMIGTIPPEVQAQLDATISGAITEMGKTAWDALGESAGKQQVKQQATGVPLGVVQKADKQQYKANLLQTVDPSDQVRRDQLAHQQESQGLPIDLSQPLPAAGGERDLHTRLLQSQVKPPQPIPAELTGEHDVRAKLIQSYKQDVSAVGEVYARKQDVERKFLAEAEKIKNGEGVYAGMSEPQKQAALGQLEQSYENQITQLAASLIANAQGLADTNVWTLDQIKGIDEFITSVAGLSRPVAKQFAPGIQSGLKALGLNDKADILPTLRRLGQGGQTKAQQLKDEADAAKKNARDAQIQAEAIDPTFGGTGTIEDAQAAWQVFFQKINEYDQKITEFSTEVADEASQFASFYASRGLYGDASKQIDSAIATLTAELPKLAPDKKVQAQSKILQLGDQALDYRIAGSTQDLEFAKLHARASSSEANLELQIASKAFSLAQADYAAHKISYDKLKGIQERYYQTLHSSADATQADAQAGFDVDAARTLNDLSKAKIEHSKALNQLAYAQANYPKSSQEYKAALANALITGQAVTQAAETQAQAARDTAIARIPTGDAVAIARARLNSARQAQQDARKFGTASAQYQQATQQVIETARAAQDAVDDVMKANYSLATALADAAGRTVDSARLRYAEARKEWQIALRKSGGRNTADVKTAKASEVQAGAAYRDALLQDKLDTIDFNQQMGTLTAVGAIAALQKILKATNLTKQQRRDLMLKIKGLQDDLRSNLTGSGFNIPDQIKLPTPYEVRRSLGIDKYVKRIQDVVSKTIGINPSTRIATELGASAAPSAIAPTATAGTSSKSLVAALDSVRQAVVANGAQVTNDIAITNQVTTPAMVDLIAKKVVELISTSTALGARANQASPKLVTY